MPYCRYCGREITYKRTKNEHWMPCNLLTGEKHFCKEEEGSVNSGLSVCPKCGKPVFANKGNIIDYTTLLPHECKKVDVTKYTKYKETAAKKNEIAKKTQPKSSGIMINTTQTTPKKKATAKKKAPRPKKSSP